MNVYIHDGKGRWRDAVAKSAISHGYTVNGTAEGIGFFRPAQRPDPLREDKKLYHELKNKVRWIQDQAQVDVYEDKVEQARRWSAWMPPTWLFESKDKALEFVDTAEYPFVSKAKEGSSSFNVSLITNPTQARKLVNDAFGKGFSVLDGYQRGYVLFQKFIKSDICYRVNAIGGGRAIFYRYNYPGQWYTQTGNVEPAFEMSEEVESLLEYSDRVFEKIGTKWCALDILKEDGQWRLIETSLAWPWPSPGRCNEGTIFRTKRKWIEMFDAMFDTLEGV
jgi:glutathione synthase/RimK-type ligase-like ATP-grasp enzyme